MKRFIFYLIRWQLITPLVWFWVHSLGIGLIPVIIFNLSCAVLFFTIDRFIFTSISLEKCQIEQVSHCSKCGKREEIWRLVKVKDYTGSGARPVFLCLECSQNKIKELREKGIKINEIFS